MRRPIAVVAFVALGCGPKAIDTRRATPVLPRDLSPKVAEHARSLMYTRDCAGWQRGTWKDCGLLADSGRALDQLAEEWSERYWLADRSAITAACLQRPSDCETRRGQELVWMASHNQRALVEAYRMDHPTDGPAPLLVTAPR